MDLAVQLLVALGLAACAGLRAWLPLLIVSLLAHQDYLVLHPSFEFLGRTDALVVFGAATAIEIVGDKFPVVDHFLDSVGAVVRPAAGTVLASAMFVSLDPLAAVVLGLVVGGGSAFTVNAGKALARAKVTALAPLHGGLGNAAVSTAEDVAAAAGLWLTAYVPVLAGFLALLAVGASAWLIFVFIRKGGHLLAWLRARGRRLGGAAAP